MKKTNLLISFLSLSLGFSSFASAKVEEVNRGKYTIFQDENANPSQTFTYKDIHRAAKACVLSYEIDDKGKYRNPEGKKRVSAKDKNSNSIVKLVFEDDRFEGLHHDDVPVVKDLIEKRQSEFTILKNQYGKNDYGLFVTILKHNKTGKIYITFRGSTGSLSDVGEGKTQFWNDWIYADGIGIGGMSVLGFMKNTHDTIGKVEKVALESISKVMPGFLGNIFCKATTTTLNILRAGNSKQTLLSRTYNLVKHYNPLTTRYNAALVFVNDYLKTSKENPENITITGHSLGGNTAQYIGAQTGLKTIAFNGPGVAAPYLDKKMLNSPQILNVVRDEKDISLFEGDVGGDAVGKGNKNNWTFSGQHIGNYLALRSIGKDYLGLHIEHSMEGVLADIENGVKPITERSDFLPAAQLIMKKTDETTDKAPISLVAHVLKEARAIAKKTNKEVPAERIFQKYADLFAKETPTTIQLNNLLNSFANSTEDLTQSQFFAQRDEKKEDLFSSENEAAAAA
jgi:hypothetical protein